MQLKQFLKTTKMNVTKFAEEIGVSQPAVSKWQNGEAIPNPTNMKKIIAYTHSAVMPNDFLEVFIKK